MFVSHSPAEAGQTGELSGCNLQVVGCNLIVTEVIMLKATGKPERGKKLLELNLNGGVKSWERRGLSQTCAVQLPGAALLSVSRISLCTASCADCCVCSGQQEKVPCSRVPPGVSPLLLLCSVPEDIPSPFELFSWRPRFISLG